MIRQEVKQRIAERAAEIADIILRGKDCEIRKSKDGISVAEISKKVVSRVVMDKVAAYGMIMTQEEYDARYGGLDKIAQYAEKYGFEVKEGETAFSIGFIAKIMEKMDSIIENNK